MRGRRPGADTLGGGRRPLAGRARGGYALWLGAPGAGMPPGWARPGRASSWLGAPGAGVLLAGRAWGERPPGWAQFSLVLGFVGARLQNGRDLRLCEVCGKAPHACSRKPAGQEAGPRAPPRTSAKWGQSFPTQPQSAPIFESSFCKSPHIRKKRPGKRLDPKEARKRDKRGEHSSRCDSRTRA